MKRRGWKLGRYGWSVLMVSAVTLILATSTRARPIEPPPDDQNAAESQSTSKPDALAGPRAEDDRAAPPRDEADKNDETDARPPRRPHRRRRAGSRDRDALGNRVRPRPFDERRDGEPPSERSRRRGDFRDRQGLGRGRDHVSPEMIDRAMEVLSDELPDWYDRLSLLRRHRPEQFDRAMRRVLPIMREYLAMRESHPELARTIIEEFRIEGQLRSMGRAYREARDDPARREELEKEIIHLVQRQFELKMQRRTARLEEIARRLQREREKLQRDQEMLPRLVRDRVRQMTQGDFRDSMRDRDRPRRRQRDPFRDRPSPRPHRRR